MVEFEATSGAKVKIAPASFEDALDLQAAIAERVSMSSFSFSVKGGTSLMEQEIDFGQIVKLAMGIIADKKVRDTVFRCLARSTYDGQRITPNTFDDVKSRQDFYEIVLACVKENLGHFIAPLTSKLSPALQGLQTLMQGQSDQK